MWPEHSGGPKWRSAGAYRPNVRKRRFRQRQGKGYVTWDKSVYFDYDDINHMWIDLGSALPQPYSVIMMGMIHSYPSATYGHYLLDAGKASPQKDVNKDWSIPDGNLSYRSAMLFQQSSALIGTHTLNDLTYGKHVRVKHNYRPVPRMFYGVFDGAHSHVGSFDPKNSYYASGPTNNHAVRYLVMGRRQEHLSDNLSSHMSIVEIRIFDDALTRNQLRKQYRQLAGKYKLNQMRNSK